MLSLSGLFSIILSLFILSCGGGNIENKQSEIQDSRIIRAGSHTVEENEKHNAICAHDGGVDVTDKNDLEVGSGVLDAVICILPYVNSEQDDETIKSLMLNNTVFSLRVEAPNNPNEILVGPYYIVAKGYYTGVPNNSAMTMNTGVLIDKCGIAGGNTVGGNGIMEVKTTCSYPSSEGTAQTYANAYLLGHHKSANGVIKRASKK